MKLIIGIVRPFLLDRIIVALESVADFPGMTVSESEGFGQRIMTAHTSQLNPLKPNKRIEILVEDDMTDAIVAVLKEQAHTGKKGDGIIAVLRVEDSTLI